MVDKTILTKAASNTTSLRTTVPSTIVKQFCLVDGDMLEWKLQAQENKMIIIVNPIKT
jgi:hypothetical protein